MGGFGSILDQPTRGQTQADIDAALAARGPGPSIGPATPQPTTPDALAAARAALFLQGLTRSGAPSTDPNSLFNGPNRYNPNPQPTLPGAQPADAASSRGVLHPSRPMGYDDYMKLADMAAGTIGLTPPHPNMTPGERLQNIAAVGSLGLGPLMESFQLSKLAGAASDAMKTGGTFDVSTGKALTGSGYLVADPEFTRTILPHENQRGVIKAFLQDPQVRQRLAQGDSHLGVYTNPDGLPEVSVTDRVTGGEGAARDLARARGQNSFGHLVDGEYQGDVPTKRDFTGRRVTGTALRDVRGNIYQRPLPSTHAHVLADVPPGTGLESRGFVLDNGTYVSPEEAMDVAEQQSQVMPGRFERNRTGPRDLHAFDLKENQPRPPAPSYRVEDEGPQEHLANAQSIVSMHQQMYGPDVHLDPADLRAVAERARKAGIDLHVTPRSSAADIMAQLQGREPNALPRRATAPIPTASPIRKALGLPAGAPEELGASPGFGYEGPQPEGGPQLPVRGLLPRQINPLALPAGATAPSRTVAEGLSREDAVAQMKTLSQQGVRAQMQPMKDGTFSIVRKGDPHPASNVPAPVKTPSPPIGLLGEPTDAGFQSRLMTAVSGNPKYSDLKLTPEDWYARLKNDPNVPKDELNALRLQASAPDAVENERQRLLGQWQGQEKSQRLHATNNRDHQLEVAARRLQDPALLGEDNEAVAQAMHDRMLKLFPNTEMGWGEHPQEPIDAGDLRRTFDREMDRALDEGDVDQDGVSQGARDYAFSRYERAAEHNNIAVESHNNLIDPNRHPDFIKQAEENSGSDPQITAMLDEKGKLAQGDLAYHIQNNSQVGRLEKRVLSGEGGEETPEPDDYDIEDRAGELKDEWKQEQHNDADILLDHRDAALDEARAEMQRLFGKEAGSDLHNEILDKHFADRGDILDKLGRNTPNEMDVEEFAKHLESLQGRPLNTEQGHLFPNETATHNDMVPLAKAYRNAIAHESDAINTMEGYHHPYDRGPDFWSAAREQLYDDYNENNSQRDVGDTKYATYQRVDENAPYREILLRDPKQERTASHWDDQAGVIAHARGEIHGSNYHMLEAQSDLAQKLNKIKRSGMGGYSELEKSLGPFGSTDRWAQLATGASLHQAAEEGSSSFSWPTPEDRMAKADLAEESANITYGHAVPKAVERIFKHLDEPIEMGEHRAGGTTFPKIKLSAAMREKILKMGVPALSTIPFVAPRVRGGLLGDRPTQ